HPLRDHRRHRRPIAAALHHEAHGEGADLGLDHLPPGDGLLLQLHRRFALGPDPRGDLCLQTPPRAASATATCRRDSVPVLASAERSRSPASKLMTHDSLLTPGLYLVVPRLSQTVAGPTLH